MLRGGGGAEGGGTLPVTLWSNRGSFIGRSDAVSLTPARDLGYTAVHRYCCSCCAAGGVKGKKRGQD